MDALPLTLKLSYRDRSALLDVIMRARNETLYRQEINDLAVRISRLECQPGGCPYCTGDADDTYDDCTL